MRSIAICFVLSLSMIIPIGTSGPSQTATNPNCSFTRLSNKAEALFRNYASSVSLSPGPNGYCALTESERSTFESVTNALETTAVTGSTAPRRTTVIDLIQGVNRIWGGEPRVDCAIPFVRFNEGKLFFRLSVTLRPDAAPALEQSRATFTDPGNDGHVLLANGNLVQGQKVMSVRETTRRPALQISWLTATPTIGDIDIDYREIFEGHLNPRNSDVRASTCPYVIFPGLHSTTRHYDRHIEPNNGYGPGLDDWWAN